MQNAAVAKFVELDNTELAKVSGGMVSRGALYAKSGQQLADFGRGLWHGIWSELG